MALGAGYINPVHEPAFPFLLLISLGQRTWLRFYCSPAWLARLLGILNVLLASFELSCAKENDLGSGGGGDSFLSAFVILFHFILLLSVCLFDREKELPITPFAFFFYQTVSFTCLGFLRHCYHFGNKAREFKARDLNVESIFIFSGESKHRKQS